MASPPLRQELECPACRRRFVVHLFRGDAAGERHRVARCPLCRFLGTAPTGTVPEPAAFVAVVPATDDGAIELALASVCLECQTFLVEQETTCRGCGQVSEARANAWHRRVDDPALEITHHSDDGDLIVHGDGRAELRERGETLYDRGRVYREAPLVLRVWSASLPREHVQRIARLLLAVAIPAPYETPVARAVIVAAGIAHPDRRLGRFGVLLNGPGLPSPQRDELSRLLRAIERELRASPPWTTVPNAPRTPAAEPGRPVARSVRPAEPPMPSIPFDECAVCSADSPFTERVTERDGDIYTVHRCPSCREDFTVYRPAAQTAVDAWIERDALRTGFSVDAGHAAVLADPRADVPRLRFAAAVAACDPPRAELIRAQLAVARLRRRGRRDEASLRQRPDLLTDADRLRRWYAGVDALVEHQLACMTTSQLRFGRGFVEGVCLTDQQFVERAAEIVRVAPMLDVGITALGDARAALFGSPHLAHVRSICLYNTGATDEDVRRLVASPHLRRLAHLDLGFCRVTDHGVDALAAASTLPGLRYVRLSDNPAADPNPVADEQDGRRYALITSSVAEELRARFGARPWLDSRYTSSEPPSVETFV